MKAGERNRLKPTAAAARPPARRRAPPQLVEAGEQRQRVDVALAAAARKLLLQAQPDPVEFCLGAGERGNQALGSGWSEGSHGWGVC